MANALWLNLGEMLRVNSVKYPFKTALQGKSASLTFSRLNRRINRLSALLLGLGLKKGDRISCFLENCLEIVELYLACAKTGVIINPINFRLNASDVAYIINNAGSSVLFVHEEFIPLIESARDSLPEVKNFFIVAGTSDIPAGLSPGARSKYSDYESALKGQPESEPAVRVNPEDSWVLLYTSGTTGRPKGVLRSHESYIAFYLINGADFGFTPNDICLNVMPLCHVNTTFFSFAITYLGGSVYVHPARHFDPAEILRIIEERKISFISLIPTHYHLLLNLPDEIRRKYNVSSVRKLLCSSAPARGDIKQRVMDYFPGVELYEGYGSTEAGIVTVLRPEEQFSKAGSIGRESSGTDCVKLLDSRRQEVGPGEIGELYSRGPMLFSGYYKMSEKNRDAFAGEWFSAGDMARRDPDGYYYLVDRKDNLIISGGEHVYPSEVEEILSGHPKVFEAAIIGLPDEKWGEKVIAIISVKENMSASVEEIIEFCRDKMASYKKPKLIKFIQPKDMPRTASGKILHRELRRLFS